LSTRGLVGTNFVTARVRTRQSVQQVPQDRTTSTLWILIEIIFI